MIIIIDDCCNPSEFKSPTTIAKRGSTLQDLFMYGRHFKSFWFPNDLNPIMKRQQYYPLYRSLKIIKK